MKKILFLIALLPFIVTAQTSTPPVNYVISYPADTTINFYNWARTQHYVDSACTTFANSLAIGNPIIGGTEHGILFQNYQNKLKDDPKFIYNNYRHQFTMSDGSINLIDINNQTDPTYNGILFAYNQNGNNWAQVGSSGGSTGSYYEDDGSSYRDYYAFVGQSIFEIQNDDNNDYGSWSTGYMPFIGSDGKAHTAFFGNGDFGATLNYNDDLHYFQFTNADSVVFDVDANIKGNINLNGALLVYDVDGNTIAGFAGGQFFTQSIADNNYALMQSDGLYLSQDFTYSAKFGSSVLDSNIELTTGKISGIISTLQDSVITIDGVALQTDYVLNFAKETSASFSALSTDAAGLFWSEHTATNQETIHFLVAPNVGTGNLSFKCIYR